MPTTMTVIEVVELLAKLGVAVHDAMKTGATHVDVGSALSSITTTVDNVTAGETKDDADAAAAADAKYGKKSAP